MFGSDVVRTMIRPFIVFVVLMVGISALLQDTLFVYKLADSYTHWAIILLALPITIGIVLRYLETEQALFIILAGAATSTVSMYFLYKTYFWAQAPTVLNALFFFAVIAGGAHLPYARGPIERFFGVILSVFKTQKKKPRNTNKTATAKKPAQKQSNPGNPAYARGGLVPVIEMSVGVASLALSVYSIAFMGKG